MATAFTDLEARIRELSPEDRALLVRNLIAELDGPADQDVEAEWLAEAQRRHREGVEGKVTPVSADRVFENLRVRLRR